MQVTLMSILDLDKQVCHSVYSAANALVRTYRPLLEPLELTYPQYLVLLSLWEQDGVSIKHLVSHTRLDAGTLTPILKRLEAKKLLKRQADSQDERQKRIVLTTKGQQLKQRALTLPEELFCRFKSGLNLQQAMELKKLCEMLYQALVEFEESDS